MPAVGVHAFRAGKERTLAHTRRVESALPPSGDVQIIYITDKQYENIVSFSGMARLSSNKNPEQYTLF